MIRAALQLSHGDGAGAGAAADQWADPVWIEEHADPVRCAIGRKGAQLPAPADAEHRVQLDTHKDVFLLGVHQVERVGAR